MTINLSKQNYLCNFLLKLFQSFPKTVRIKPNSLSSVGKESTCNAGDTGAIPGLGRSPEGGKGYPLQYSCLENSMECIVHGVTKSWTWLSYFHFHFLSFDWITNMIGPAPITSFNHLLSYIPIIFQWYWPLKCSTSFLSWDIGDYWLLFLGYTSL